MIGTSRHWVFRYGSNLMCGHVRTSLTQMQFNRPSFILAREAIHRARVHARLYRDTFEDAGVGATIPDAAVVVASAAVATGTGTSTSAGL